MTDPAAKLRELLIGDRLDVMSEEARRLLESLKAEFPKQLSNRRDRREEDRREERATARCRTSEA